MGTKVEKNQQINKLFYILIKLYGIKPHKI